MRHRELPVDLLQLVTPQQARSYALAKRWQRVREVDGDIALFERSGTDFAQLIVPMDSSADDYPRRIADVVDTLAEVESRAAMQVLQDILRPDSDVMRYSVVSEDAKAGVLPLQDGIRLLQGARRSLLAAACSVVSPSHHHPRMSRTEATQLVDACQLGQTERGSFTAAIVCPLRAVEQEQTLIQGAEPFTRRATSLLMKSASRLVRAIEFDQVPTVYEDDLNEPMLSANLCEALLRMQPQGERSVLSVSVNWASTLPPAENQSPPGVVRIRHEYFEIIADVFKKLRPSQAPTESLFIGQVDALNGDIGDDGRMQGEVTLLLLHEEELVKARTELNPDEYQTAVDAHRIAGFIRCSGILHLGRRTHRLTNVSGFLELER